jgi:hypothetical protein
MRILPCKSKCVGQPALMVADPPTLYTIGSILSSSITYKCARCGLLSRISSSEFHSLPLDPAISDPQ